jgi:hypothetical protein
VANSGCRIHGGPSTGPKTEARIKRIRQAGTKHGRYSVSAKELRKQYRALVSDSRELLCHIRSELSGAEM